MGTFQKGILGGFSGTVGTVVGATWRGKDIMRSRPKKTSREPTPLQLEQRLKFTLVAQFLAPIRPILVAFFGQPQGIKSKRNLATSYHLQEAVIGISPDFAIDFSKVVVSKGELLGLQEPAVVLAANAQLDVTWEDNAGQAEAESDDGLLLVVYNEARGFFETRENAALRSAGSYSAAMPSSWTGDTVHVWIAFATADKKKVSTSIYFGPLQLI